jgi:uncharacterized membrane protein
MNSSQLPVSARSALPPDVSLDSLLLGVAGGALIASRRRLPRGAREATTLAGVAMLGLAAYPSLAGLLRRIGTRRRATEIRMSFMVAQPVERVFAFCRDFENFPRFIGALRHVQDYGDGRSRWCASTPAGGSIEWNTVTTKYVPNRVIAWETSASEPVQATGMLRFMPDDGRTCVQLLLTYALSGTSGMKEALAALVSPARDGQLEADVHKLAAYLDSAPDAELAAYDA